MIQTASAAYKAPELEVLLIGMDPVICASIDNVTEEDFEFDWV